jgi:hypothetical protein
MKAEGWRMKEDKGIRFDSMFCSAFSLHPSAFILAITGYCYAAGVVSCS